MRHLIAALVVLSASAPLAALADEKPLEGDAKTLQGTWTAKGPDGSPLSIVFDKDRIAIKIVAPGGEERTIEGTYTLDTAAKPRAMTWTGVKMRGRDLPDLAAIYELTDDDTLKLAGVGGTRRPTEFIEKGKELPGVRPNTMILTRAKDKDEAKK